MKHLTNYIVLLISELFLLLSCSSSDKRIQQLSVIKEKGNTEPAAALAQLDSIMLLMDDEPKHTKMCGELLRLRLQDKADIVPESDEKGKELYTYFMKHGNASERQEVCYYLASVYRDLHDSPRAIKYFQESLDVAENFEGIDSTIIANTCSQLNFLYAKQFNNQSAYEMAKKGLDVARACHIVDPIYLMDVANAAYAMNDLTTMLKYQQEAFDSIKKEHSFMQYSFIICEMLYNLSASHFIKQAQEVKQMVDDVEPEHRPINYNLALARYYKSVEKNDSVILFFKKCVNESSDLLEKRNGALNLSIIYDKKNDVHASNYYGIMFIELEEDYMNSLQHEQAMKAHNEYIYNRNQTEEEKAYREAEQAKKQRAYWILASLVLTAMSISVFLLMKNRNLKHANMYLRKINDMEGKIKENRQVIKEKEEYILVQKEKIRQSQVQLDGLAECLQKKEREIISKDAQLSERRIILMQKNDELKNVEKLLHEKENLLAEKLTQNEKLFKFAFTENLIQNAGDILDKFRKAANGRYRLSNEEWKHLFSAVEELYPEFRNAIMQKLKKPTEDKLRISYLLKAGMTNPQIENLTGYPTTTVWRKVKNIMEIMKDELLML